MTNFRGNKVRGKFQKGFKKIKFRKVLAAICKELERQ